MFKCWDYKFSNSSPENELAVGAEFPSVKKKLKFLCIGTISILDKEGLNV